MDRFGCLICASHSRLVEVLYPAPFIARFFHSVTVLVILGPHLPTYVICPLDGPKMALLPILRTNGSVLAESSNYPSSLVLEDLSKSLQKLSTGVINLVSPVERDDKRDGLFRK